jgi:hypothetical protein
MALTKREKERLDAIESDERNQIFDARGKPRREFQTDNIQESVAIIEEGDETDVTSILKRFAQTGFDPAMQLADAEFLDISEVPDHATSLQNLRRAEEWFMQLDPRIRKMFGDDVGNYVDASEDPQKAELMKRAIEIYSEGGHTEQAAVAEAEREAAASQSQTQGSERRTTDTGPETPPDSSEGS